MTTEGSEDREVGDVHGPHTDFWTGVPKESGSGDEFRAGTDGR